MMKYLFALTLLLAATAAHSQTAQKLAQAFHQFENDPQLKNGLASLCVMDAATGKIIFEKNSSMGLAPASTQKIITAATAYELLGKDFRYRTGIALMQHGGQSRIVIKASGDPTLGSWRWKETNEEAVMKRILDALSAAGLSSYDSIIVDEKNWEGEAIPGGWVWDDIGNYYGAGAAGLNWRENQFDLILQSGEKLGDAVQIKGTKPKLYDYPIQSLVTAAAKGSGDNAYIYFPVGRKEAVVRGTIPVGENNFTISGALPSSKHQLLSTLKDSLAGRGISMVAAMAGGSNSSMQLLHSEVSPPLDSISYWFLRRSINLYGEALAKTIALEKGKIATTANGVKEIINFWKGKNLDIAETELNLFDGSGLSPLNRTTTRAQVMILAYARKQSWFNSFFAGFPEFNNMKMKSGTINGVKGFCGYHRSASGKEYIFSFLVNNYNGSASAVVQKMYKVLNELK